MDYKQVATTLVDRIVALIPSHPEILTLESPWGLFKIAGFQCDDLQPTLMQASYALADAKKKHLASSRQEPT